MDLKKIIKFLLLINFIIYEIIFYYKINNFNTL